MTQEKKQATWLTTYLISFILLHNVALITKHDSDYARKHRMTANNDKVSCQILGHTPKNKNLKKILDEDPMTDLVGFGRARC